MKCGDNPRLNSARLLQPSSQNIQPVFKNTKNTPRFVLVVSNNVALLPRLERALPQQAVCVQQATLDDHSKVVPPLPIPNRTVKHLSADDS